MIYDTGEYDLTLEIPTDNFVVKNFFSIHTEHIDKYIQSLQPKDKKTLIILLGVFHCIEERHYWVEPMNDFCKNIENPLIVFTGKLTPSDVYKFKENQFYFERLSIFDFISNLHWNRRVENKLRNWNADSDHLRSNKFYWASSKDWYTRRFVLAGLIKNNLLEGSLINYKCINTNIPGHWMEHRISEEEKKLITQECLSIQNSVPLPSIDDTLEFTQTNVDFYLNSNLGIITDTFFEQGLFFSEKVFNAINYQQIFFYIGHNGSLDYLKNIGYHTFDDIIDTDYDKIEDTGKRLIAARQSLVDFLKQPLHTIQSAYKHSIEGIKHNKHLLGLQRPDIKFTEILQRTLNEH